MRFKPGHAVIAKRIKSFCVVPTKMLDWTEPQGLLFGVLMIDGSVKIA